MPYPIPSHEPRDRAALQRHYELERRLADRLRQADRDQRQRLYAEVYDLLFRSLPDHPQLVHGEDPAARSELIRLQATLLGPYLTPSTTLVEFGPGNAALAVHLAPKVRSVYVVEASTVVLEADDLPHTVRVVDAAAEPLPIPDRSVDVAFSSHFVEHLHPEDLAVHLADVARLLSPAGAYVCVTPNRVYGPHDISRYFDDQATGLHLSELTHRELATAMRVAGLRRVRRLRGVGIPPHEVGLGPSSWLELLLTTCPAFIRRRLTALPERFGSRPPFRPLEQVAVIGRR
jgi:SAM-dependent methyltransferase